MKVFETLAVPRWNRGIAWAVLGLGSLWVGVQPGCGGGVHEFCDKICECEGCSDNEYEQCHIQLDYVSRMAEGAGCAEQFDALLSCRIPDMACEDGDADWDDGCEDQEDAWDDCM